MNRSYYATPSELSLRPWTLDFTPDEAGNPPFPHDFIVNPYPCAPDPSDPYPGKKHPKQYLTWQTDDSDPALRFWTLPFDPNLREWLESVNPDAVSTMAALEFASQFDKWNKWDKPGEPFKKEPWKTKDIGHEGDKKGTHPEDGLLDAGWLELDDVLWLPDRQRFRITRDRNGDSIPDATIDKVTPKEVTTGFDPIVAEIEQLQQLMQDDRQRYLAESEWQADGTADYFIHFLGASRARHPWTIELIACAMSISHVAHMYYKHRFKRVRPSFLCPGLVPPFGPPAHPSFPSGHSSQGHLIALLLLEIRGLAYRYGVFGRSDAGKRQNNGSKPAWDALNGRNEIDSPLLWLAQRIAKNRERIGVHYASDSSASRHLAAGIWKALRNSSLMGDQILCPTLELVIRRAAAEWPDPPVCP